MRVCGRHGDSLFFVLDGVANPCVRSHGRRMKQSKYEKWGEHTKGVETFASDLRVADPLLPLIPSLDCCTFSSPNNFHIDLGRKEFVFGSRSAVFRG